MNKKTTKEVTVDPKGTNVVIPGTAPRGFENEDASDLLLPRIELLQGLSAAVQEGKGRAGDIVNQISKSPISTDIFIPIAMQRKYIKWIPRSEGGGIEYQTPDPADVRVIADTKWGANGEKPSCTSYMNFLVLLEGETLPIVLSFSMTNYNEGKKLYTMAKMANCDIWDRKYKLAAKSKTNASGTWHVWDISEAGKSEAVDRTNAEALYHSFGKTGFKTAEEESTPKATASKDEDY